MTAWLTDDVIGHLRAVASWPDLSGTKYSVVEEIGRGGMGTVYRAEDTQLGRDVAIKVINAAGDHAVLAARLALEARVLARLDHPGVVPIHECGTLADGRAFYVMKLVRGVLLDDWLMRGGSPSDAATEARETSVDGGVRTASDAGETRARDAEELSGAERTARLDQRLQLFERIAEPVAFAHAHGIVHRDLKPQNVMIGPFGEVLVMDWGAARLPHLLAHGSSIDDADADLAAGAEAGTDAVADRGAMRIAVATARVENDDASRGQRGLDREGAGLEALAGGHATRAGAVIGTPGYMSPEQARGTSAEVDPRADVYALGALLLQMVSGAPPPPDAEAAAAAAARMTGVSKQLRAVITKALDARPEDRYADARALAADIARVRAGQPVDAYPETWLDRLTRFYGTYHMAILLVLAYLTMRTLVALFWHR